jgi:hypothetical protein
MKITDEDFKKLAEMITPLDTPERRAAYKQGNYPRSEFTRNVNKRYRWDLLFKAGGLFQQGNFMSELYRYLNDSHIDTALRKLVPDL